jgi:hypothetical protein
MQFRDRQEKRGWQVAAVAAVADRMRRQSAGDAVIRTLLRRAMEGRR